MHNHCVLIEWQSYSNAPNYIWISPPLPKKWLGPYLVLVHVCYFPLSVTLTPIKVFTCSTCVHVVYLTVLVCSVLFYSVAYLSFVFFQTCLVPLDQLICHTLYFGRQLVCSTVHHHHPALHHVHRHRDQTKVKGIISKYWLYTYTMYIVSQATFVQSSVINYCSSFHINVWAFNIRALFAPGGYFGVHRHPYYLIQCILNGSFSCVIQ